MDGLSTHTHNLMLAHTTLCIQYNVCWPGGAHTQKTASTQLFVGTHDLVCSNINSLTISVPAIFFQK